MRKSAFTDGAQSYCLTYVPYKLQSIPYGDSNGVTVAQSNRRLACLAHPFTSLPSAAHTARMHAVSSGLRLMVMPSQ